MRRRLKTCSFDELFDPLVVTYIRRHCPDLIERLRENVRQAEVFTELLKRIDAENEDDPHAQPPNRGPVLH